jgi:hypothetical protein
MTAEELQSLIASIRQNIYTWCGGETIEKVEKLIRFAEQMQKERSGK